MNYVQIFIIAVALSMDAASVSISNGISIRNLNLKKALITSLAFGIFQGIMPILGYFAGSFFISLINALSNWIGFILLGVIGAKMIFEALKQNDGISVVKNLSLKLVLIQAIATSIDAMAVGVTLVSTPVNVYISASIIAVVTFIISFICVLIGKKFGNILGNKAEVVGGAILIIIGITMLIKK